MAYNQGSYKDYNNTTSEYEQYIGSSDVLAVAGKVEVLSGGITEVKSGGELEFESGSLLQLEAGSKVTYPSEVISTGSTATIAHPYGLTEIKSTGGTKKEVTLTSTGVGTRKVIYCSAASATGYCQVNVGSTGLTFDGTNYIYKFLKADTSVEIYRVTTNRWIEIYRSVADGTALGSTST